MICCKINIPIEMTTRLYISYSKTNKPEGIWLDCKLFEGPMTTIRSRELINVDDIVYILYHSDGKQVTIDNVSKTPFYAEAYVKEIRKQTREVNGKAKRLRGFKYYIYKTRVMDKYNLNSSVEL